MWPPVLPKLDFVVPRRPGLLAGGGGFYLLGVGSVFAHPQGYKETLLGQSPELRACHPEMLPSIQLVLALPRVGRLGRVG